MEIVDDVADHPQNFAVAGQLATERRNREESDVTRMSQNLAAFARMFNSMGTARDRIPSQSQANVSGVSPTAAAADDGASAYASGEGTSSGEGDSRRAAAATIGAAAAAGGGRAPQGLSGVLASLVQQVIPGMSAQAAGRNVQFHILQGGAGDGIAPLMNLLGGLNGNQLASNPGDYVTSNEALQQLMTQLLQSAGGSGGAPPTAQSLLDDLPRTDVTEESMANFELDCAVCKDSFSCGDKLVHLPCKHYYHEECILPWLRRVGAELLPSFPWT